MEAGPGGVSQSLGSAPTELSADRGSWEKSWNYEDITGGSWNEGTPKMDGFCKGKSPSNMDDDWG